jgi:hypothetical protein
MGTYNRGIKKTRSIMNDCERSEDLNFRIKPTNDTDWAQPFELKNTQCDSNNQDYSDKAEEDEKNFQAEYGNIEDFW